MSAGGCAAITMISFVFYLLASPYRQTCYLFTPLGDLRWNVNCNRKGHIMGRWSRPTPFPAGIGETNVDTKQKHVYLAAERT